MKTGEKILGREREVERKRGRRRHIHVDGQIWRYIYIYDRYNRKQNRKSWGRREKEIHKKMTRNEKRYMYVCIINICTYISIIGPLLK